MLKLVIHQITMSLQLVIGHGGTTEKVPDLSQRRRIVMRTKDQRVSQKNRLAGFHRNIRRIWVATVACCVSAGSILVPGAAKAASPIPITACQSITATGYYQVQKALSSAGGDCLVIQASNVTLDLNGKAISGAGTGAGIHVLATAPGTKTGKEGSGTKTEAEGKGTKTGTQ